MQIARLVQRSLTPLLYLNVAIMVIAGGWLGLEGLLGLVLPPVMMLVFSPLVFPFLMIPAAFFGGLMQMAPQYAKWFALCSFLYLDALLAFYIAGTFTFVDPLSRGGAGWFALAFAIGASLCPWILFASRDRGNIFFTGLILMGAATALLLAGLIVQMHLDGFGALFLVAFAAMAGMTGLQALYEKIFMQQPPAAQA